MEQINQKKVQVGYELCKSHILSLLESSEILYKSKKFTESLSLSILAREEVAKLIALQDHLKNNTSMPYDEWLKLTKNTKESTAHKQRLVEPMRQSREYVQSMPPSFFETMKDERKKMGLSEGFQYAAAMSLTPEFEKSFEKLDKVKQACFYFGLNKNWYNLSILLEKNEKDALAYATLIATKILYYSTISIRVHHQIQHPIGKTLEKDPNFQKCLSLMKEIQSAKYKTRLIFVSQALNKIPSYGV